MTFTCTTESSGAVLNAKTDCRIPIHRLSFLSSDADCMVLPVDQVTGGLQGIHVATQRTFK
jgi:hypothetical protein